MARIGIAATGAGLILGLALAGAAASQIPSAGLDPAAVQKALQYTKSMKGLALVILRDGKTILEDYHNDFAAADSHILTSATKGFSGVLLAALVEDKLAASFDEKISETIVEWKDDPSKAEITLRDLLSLSSGLDPGPLGRMQSYSQALAAPVLHPRGSVFQYGPAPYQIFGEVVKRKLKGESPLDYLTRRIFKPIGLVPTGWRIGQDGNPAMASGADMKAVEWAKFGEFIRNRGRWEGRPIVRADLVEEILRPGTANPAFGLGFWLKIPADLDAEESGRVLRREEAERGTETGLPFKIIMAGGAGKQRLYIIDELRLVVVRQGKASAFKDADFLGRLLAR